MSENTTDTVKANEPRPVEAMTDREIAEETLYWLRQAGEALIHIQSGGMSQIMKAMMGGK